MRRRKRGRVLAPAGSFDPSKRAVRFFRSYKSFHGGHLKVFDYFNHVAASPAFAPHIFFSPNSVWDETNPWAGADLVEIDPSPPAVHFLAGRDWVHIDPKERARPRVPVINLVQHVRHADPGHPLGEFLPHPAIRVCVSREVADAVTQAGANGPVHAIPNGIDLGTVTTGAAGPRDVDLLIVANKKPEMGAEIRQILAEMPSVLVDEMIPRETFLDLLGRARVAVFLPNDTEGFYLPALEAMALGTIVVCPDVVGNRSFCVDGRTAFLRPFDRDALIQATRDALSLRGDDADRYVAAGREMASAHDLGTERATFLAILDDIDGAWNALGYPRRP